MKMYCDEQHLRMVGKVWQISAKLRELSRASLTLKQFLQPRKGKAARGASIVSLPMDKR